MSSFIFEFLKDPYVIVGQFIGFFKKFILDDRVIHFANIKGMSCYVVDQLNDWSFVATSLLIWVLLFFNAVDVHDRTIHFSNSC